VNNKRSRPRAQGQRAGIDEQQILDAAMELVDGRGLDALTMMNVARELGVTQPTLYNHVPNLEYVRAQVALRGVVQLTAHLERATAGLAGEEALHALISAYASYVMQHPDRYLLQVYTTSRTDLTDIVERAAEVTRNILRMLGLSEREVYQAHNVLRSFTHGLVDLTHRAGPDRFVEPNDALQFFYEVFAAGLRARVEES
jgi:AcrR family transcriptional regulator